MPNPADDVPTDDCVKPIVPSRRSDTKDSRDMLSLIRSRTRVLAKITALSPNMYGDEFVADLYADGRVDLATPEDMYKTHTGIMIYNLDIYTSNTVGDVVFINLNPDNTGYILPPSGGGADSIGTRQGDNHTMVTTHQDGWGPVRAT